MKEFITTKYYRGIYLKCHVVCATKKKAAEIFDYTNYYISTYANSFEARNKICIESPNKLFAEFEHSGEAGYFLPKSKIGVLMPYDTAKEIIDAHREQCLTYQQTIEKYNNK